MSRSTAARLLGAAIIAPLALTGCGLGAGEDTDELALRITDGFGRNALLDTAKPRTAGEDTVLRLLQRNAQVKTDQGGSFVTAVDGRDSGKGPGGATLAWLYFVNGVAADRGAAELRAATGDRIWWDRFDVDVANVSAVVGSFPAPFAGRPEAPDVALACAPTATAACDAAEQRLSDAGATVRRGGWPAAAPGATPRVLVGRWDALRGDALAATIARGPKTSGVFARPDGTTLRVLAADGRPARTLRGGWGLVAATAKVGTSATWVVTGATDDDAAAAADALRADALQGHFAALAHDGRVEGLPVAR